MIEQRNQKRFKTIWKVYFEHEGKYEFVGYLMDIAEGGARFFIEKTQHFKHEKGIKLKVVIKPDELEVPVAAINVETRWIKEWNSTEGTCEMGVQFLKNEKQAADDYLKYLTLQFSEKEK